MKDLMISPLHNHCWVCWWQNFENQPIGGKVMCKSIVFCCFRLTKNM